MEELPLILELLGKHAWPAASIAIIGLLVRALKSPSVPAPLSRIPARARPLVALLFGIVSGVLEAVVAGTVWWKALLGGALAAAVAIASHQLVIEGARDGRELGVPKPRPEPEAPPKVEVSPPAPLDVAKMAALIASVEARERETEPPATPRNTGER